MPAFTALSATLEPSVGIRMRLNTIHLAEKNGVLTWIKSAERSLHEQHRDGRDVYHPVCAGTEQQVGRRVHPAGADHDEIASGEPRLPDDGLGHWPHEDVRGILDPRGVEELPRLGQSSPCLPVVIAPDLAFPPRRPSREAWVRADAH